MEAATIAARDVLASVFETLTDGDDADFGHGSAGPLGPAGEQWLTQRVGSRARSMVLRLYGSSEDAFAHASSVRPMVQNNHLIEVRSADEGAEPLILLALNYQGDFEGLSAVTTSIVLLAGTILTKASEAGIKIAVVHPT